MNENKIYLVMPSGMEQHNKYRFAFSTYEKAKAYTQKFKENNKFVIIEKELDKPFVTNKVQSPYSVDYFENEDIHEDVYLIDDDAEVVELALKNEYSIIKDDDDVIRQFSQYLFASNKKEAIALAKEMRKDLIATGAILFP